MKEIFFGLWSFLVPTIILIVFLGNLAKKLKNSAGKSCRLPPGRKGWPLIGDSLNWYNAVSGSHPPQFVEEQVKRFGKIFSCNLFGKVAVVSADAMFNRFVMQNEGRLFKSSYPKSFRDLVGKNGVITVQGEQQRKLHSIASNTMRMEKLKYHFLDDIQKVMAQTLGSLHDDQEICLQDVCRKVAINLMVNQLFGVSNDEAEVTEMAQLFSDFADGCLSLPINFPGSAYHTAMKAREEIIRKINKRVEKQREEGWKEGGDGGVVGRVLEEGSLGDDVIADFIINLLFAGNETTAKTMLFAAYFLTQNPKAMDQILEEHDRIKAFCEGEEMLTWQDYKAMSFTQCVIDETLRLGGIAIWLMRDAKEDVEYQDYVIPKGCFVVPFLSAVHLDENLYKGATIFNPWRWLDPQNQGKRNWRNSPFFAPFGGGSRFCPGAELARLQISLFLHFFLTSFRWTQIKEDKMSFFPSARLVNGFQIRLTGRHTLVSR